MLNCATAYIQKSLKMLLVWVANLQSNHRGNQRRCLTQQWTLIVHKVGWSLNPSSLTMKSSQSMAVNVNDSARTSSAFLCYTTRAASYDFHEAALNILRCMQQPIIFPNSMFMKYAGMAALQTICQIVLHAWCEELSEVKMRADDKGSNSKPVCLLCCPSAHVLHAKTHSNSATNSDRYIL